MGVCVIHHNVEFSFNRNGKEEFAYERGRQANDIASFMKK